MLYGSLIGVKTIVVENAWSTMTYHDHELNTYIYQQHHVGFYKLHVHCLCLTMGCTADILNFDLMMMMVMKYGFFWLPYFHTNPNIAFKYSNPKARVFC